MTESNEILFDVRDGIGHILMNRPKALNALNLPMVRALDATLKRWESDNAVQAILIQGEGEKAFCAGGDVRVLHDHRDEVGGIKADFFREEYILNRRIKRFPKPYVALLDGTTMGGGVGLSVHGDFRIATERTVFAMPETAIGLFPDVGGGYFLPRCPGEIGMFLTMTGARLRAADCLYAEIATHYMGSDQIPAFLDGLTADTIQERLEALASDPGAPKLAAAREELDQCFSASTVEGIVAALSESKSEWCEKTLSWMAGKSPTSQKISYRQVREGATMEFEENMIMEYRMSQACMAGHDFYEGVRSVLVDKDHAPKWSPATLEEVTDEIVDAHFVSLGDQDLKFD